MTQETKSEISRADEIDLLELGVKAMLLVRKYRRSIGILLACGLLASLTVFLLTPKRYTSTLVCTIPFLEHHELQEIVATMNSDLRARQFSPELDDPSSESWATLHEIKLGEKGSRETEHSFTLSATMSSMKHLSELESGILSHIERTGKLILSNKRESIDKKIALLNDEVAKVDTMLKNPQKAAVDVVDLLRLKIELQTEVLDLEEEILSMGSVTVIQGFSFGPSTRYADMAVIIGVGLCASAVVVLLVVGFQELRLVALERKEAYVAS